MSTTSDQDAYQNAVDNLRAEKRSATTYTMCVPTSETGFGPVGKIKMISGPDGTISALFKKKAIAGMSIQEG